MQNINILLCLIPSYDALASLVTSDSGTYIAMLYISCEELPTMALILVTILDYPTTFLLALTDLYNTLKLNLVISTTNLYFTAPVLFLILHYFFAFFM